MEEAAGAGLLPQQLERWTEAGLIDADQASRIRAAEHAQKDEPPERRMPLVAEVVGYLGAIIAITAIGAVTHQSWKHVPPSAELIVAGVLAIGLLTGGAAVRAGGEPALARLRGVLWFLGTASAAGFVAVVTRRYLHLSGDSVALCAEGAWLACAVPLWWRARSALQQAAAFGGAIALVETCLERIDPNFGSFGFGLALWVLAGAWAIAVYLGYFTPRTMGVLLSSGGLQIGAIVAMDGVDSVLGSVMAVVTVAGLLAAGVVSRRVLLTGVGAAGALYVIPDVAHEYLPGSVAAPLATAVVGLVLVGIALWLARLRRRA
jgi:hypothetical protein